MTVVGSIQLQRYRSARRRGASMTLASVESGIALAEARLIENDELEAAAREDRAPFADAALASVEPLPNPAAEFAAQLK